MASFFRTYRTTTEGQRVDGVFAMAFIHNGRYHLTHISIYSDGMIDCWGLVDLEEFKQKVRSGWVVTQPPPGASISVSSLAEFTATDASYWIEPEEFIREVEDEIEELNSRQTSMDICRAAFRAYRESPSETTKDALILALEAVPKHNRKYIIRNDHPILAVLYPEHPDKEPRHR